MARRPRVALTLGDAAGIGPELVAKLLSDPKNIARADIYVLANEDEVESAKADGGNVNFAIASSPGQDGVKILSERDNPTPSIPRASVTKEAGARAMHQLRRAVHLKQKGEIDAIVFAPLNKGAMKMAGMKEEDELRWFANMLEYEGTTSEINIIEGLWTGRVTSHVGVEEVAALVTKERVRNAILLTHQLLWESGLDNPRLAVCALNPHNGECGCFGRQEIEEINPGIKLALEQLPEGSVVDGSFPCDTIFLKREQYDGIVTMYHDQGQIAMKLLGFDGGVTLQGGLPIVIATPAHGTAFDIVGKEIAGVGSMQKAFDIAATMAERRMAKERSIGKL
ncbi:4-hydroxythreonine-4-phosphate dehydrogenase [Massarina eburnea CBS 473.64]|uniref:4-hydroxythreonine-4-phosphate dehydrogenase n=1 Tax=Massarina eburnea CBS 473.64 TaxID=1395130 RepID=A0A6A6SEU1_9PLEO|nr:4-hydroxythreonine-4-phosphate dehydrogenase [Massarina eburnea CBS 473.64]